MPDSYPRVPLIEPLTNRGLTTAGDRKIVNGYAEQDTAGTWRVVKRPGYTQTFTGPAGKGQGLFSYNGAVYSISNDEFYIPATNTSLPLSPTVAGLVYQSNQLSPFSINPYFIFKSNSDYYIGVGTPIVSIAKFTSQANYPATTVPGIAFLDGYIFVMDPNGNIWNSALGSETGFTALGVIALNNEPNGGAAIAKLNTYIVGFGVWTMEFFYDAGTPPPASPLAPNTLLTTQIGCAAGNSVVELQASIVWVGQTKKEGAGVYMVDASYTPKRISTPFVDRLIQNDPLTSVSTYTVDIFGTSQYVLNLNTTGITLVYDFHTSIWTQWTSLSLGATFTITSLTCDAYGTVTAAGSGFTMNDGDPVTISGAATSGYNGLVNVSNPSTTTFTYQVGTALASNTGTASMQVYTEGIFSPTAAVQVNDVDYLQDPTSGVIYTQSDTATLDGSHQVPIDLQVVTERWDGGNSMWKFCRRISLMADMESSNALISYTDTDYATYSLTRIMSLNEGQRATVTPCGRFRRRAFKIRHTAATLFRAEALELEIYPGDF